MDKDLRRCPRCGLPPPGYFTVQGAARYMGLDADTIVFLLKRKELRTQLEPESSWQADGPNRRKRQLWVTLESIARYIEDHSVGRQRRGTGGGSDDYRFLPDTI